MGIPRLSHHLEPYSSPLDLGCNEVKCKKRRQQRSKVIIDGPSLAHHVYQKLLTSKTDGYALPSYDDAGKATTLLLDELQVHGLEM